MMMCQGNVGGGTPSLDSWSLQRAGIPLSLRSMSTPTEKESLSDVRCATACTSTPATSPSTQGPNFFPLSSGRMAVSSQSGSK